MSCGAWVTTKSSATAASRDTTNNRMELMAAIVGLEALRTPCQVVLVTDSQYVRQGHHPVAAKLEAQKTG